METATLTPEVTTMSELKVADRCDHGECAAQAHVRVAGKSGLTIDFCGHHYHKHELSLVSLEWSIVHDTRETLKTRPADVEE